MRNAIITYFLWINRAPKNNPCTYEVTNPVSYTHLLDFLEQAEGKNQNLADKQIALAGGGTLNFTILTSGGYGVQIQSPVSYTHLDVYKRQFQSNYKQVFQT